jgi:hypothetical protein
MRYMYLVDWNDFLPAVVGYFMGSHPNHFKNFIFLVYTIILHQIWLQEGIPGPKLP